MSLPTQSPTWQLNVAAVLLDELEDVGGGVDVVVSEREAVRDKDDVNDGVGLAEGVGDHDDSSTHTVASQGAFESPAVIHRKLIGRHVSFAGCVVEHAYPPQPALPLQRFSTYACVDFTTGVISSSSESERIHAQAFAE